MADELFIDDGYTRKHSIPAVHGLNPAVEVEYRPALHKERLAYSAKLATRDVDIIDRHECDLIARQKVSLNGVALTRETVGRLVPAIRQQLIDLVLGYTAAMEMADLKN